MKVHENHELKNNLLPFYFKGRTLEANNSSLYSNWHENIELLYFTRGTVAVFANSKRHVLREGEIFAIGANSLHSIAASDVDVEYYYLIVDRSFCTENGFDSSLLGLDCKIDSDKMRALFCRLIDGYKNPGAPFSTLLIRNTVLEVMAEICLNHAQILPTADKPSRISTSIKKAIALIDTSFDSDLSLDGTADFVGLDKFYFSHEFKKYTGQTFVSYLNGVRCKNAKALLRESELSIAEIGKKCGFQNRSYFAKTFLKYEAVTPMEYRKKHV